MNYITAEELDLLIFFEVDPKKLDPEVAWPYNNLWDNNLWDTHFAEPPK